MNTVLRILMATLAVGLLASCQSKAPGKLKPRPVGPVNSAFQSGNWQRVRTNPPTYFPKGIPADHPTDFRDGSWVYSGDPQGSRFFIPAHGTAVRQEQLIAEAQKTMTPAARKELDKAGKKIRARDFTAKTVEGIARVIGATAGAMAHVAANAPSIPTPTKKTPSAPPASTPLPETPASGE